MAQDDGKTAISKSCLEAVGGGLPELSGYEVLYNKQLAPRVFMMRFRAPEIAVARKAGQFIIIQTDVDYGERVPLTIANADPSEGSITVVFQTIGKTTEELSRFAVGSHLPVIAGPMGTPTHIENYGHVVAVGGGIGLAPLYPITQALKKAGNRITMIAGARTKELVIMEDELRKVSDNFIPVTDDGSYGRKCLVTQPLKEICEQDKPDLVIAIGPAIMMKFCAETTRPYGIHTLASLNTIMIDGTGMCGCCRVTVDGKMRFVCVDGPEFDAHLVDFDTMMKRMSAFKPQETKAREHHCRMAQTAAILAK